MTRSDGGKREVENTNHFERLHNPDQRLSSLQIVHALFVLPREVSNDLEQVVVTVLLEVVPRSIEGERRSAVVDVLRGDAEEVIPQLGFDLLAVFDELFFGPIWKREERMIVSANDERNRDRKTRNGASRPGA